MIGAGGADTERGTNKKTRETGSAEIWSEINNIYTDNKDFG